MIMVAVVRLGFFGNEGMSWAEWISLLIFVVFIPYQICFVWLAWKCYKIRGGSRYKRYKIEAVSLLVDDIELTNVLVF